MSYKHLTQNERYQIAVLSKGGHERSDIAQPVEPAQDNHWPGDGAQPGTAGLGDLLEIDLAATPLSRLYRASNLLLTHREVIKTRLFARIETVFCVTTSVMLYNLTNTYFEGAAPFLLANTDYSSITTLV